MRAFVGESQEKYSNGNRVNSSASHHQTPLTKHPLVWFNKGVERATATLTLITGSDLPLERHNADKENTMTETTKTNATTTLTRANRIAIQTTPVGFKADFYRTHKHLATMLSEDTAWTPDETANKSAQREDFRQYAINNAGTIGILWQPEDLRTESNKRIPKYTTDEILKGDAVDMLWSDLWNLTQECGMGVAFGILTADLITPMTKTAKGYDLSKMGIVDGKYSSTGNWAWAEIEMTLTLTKAEQEIYYTTKLQLVSGQLKKPHITKTSFTEDIKKSLKEIGLYEEPTKEAKADTKSAEAEDTKVEVRAEEKTKYEVSYVIKAGLPRGQERAETMVVEAQNAEEACKECKRIMKEVHGINAFRPEAKRI